MCNESNAEEDDVDDEEPLVGDICKILKMTINYLLHNNLFFNLLIKPTIDGLNIILNRIWIILLQLI